MFVRYSSKIRVVLTFHFFTVFLAPLFALRSRVSHPTCRLLCPCCFRVNFPKHRIALAPKNLATTSHIIPIFVSVKHINVRHFSIIQIFCIHIYCHYSNSKLVVILEYCIIQLWLMYFKSANLNTCSIRTHSSPKILSLTDVHLIRIGKIKAIYHIFLVYHP
ncbi:hypothetical protein MT325_m461L [Paramecium bursaria chlorella virus MT325]|uniref:Uncharacterized protein m461L n=1 Tax=Paramecium bursaria Chlorella virus MT325 TaxID=346932 RepID=A7IUJ1_PBCVM|nr:hypothetical protein MT325_m461L [Paramecium bursaria chlorella virus MT325]